MDNFVNDVYNFNILVGSGNSKESAISEIFDTIYCSDDLKAKFKIMILYSFFLSQNIDCFYMKLLLKYYTDLKGNKKNLFITLIDQNVNLSNVIDEKSMNPDNSMLADAHLPNGIKCAETGRFIVNSDIAFPNYGNYQLELFYKLKADEDDKLAAIYPITVEKKEYT